MQGVQDMRDADSGGRSDGSDVGARPETDEEKTKKQDARLGRIERALSTAGILDPGTSDTGPTGTVTLGEKAGSLAPWVAHDVLGTAAASVATAASDAVKGGRVLVTDDAALLRSDLLSHVVHETLAHHSAALDVGERVRAAIEALDAATAEPGLEIVDSEEPTRAAAGGGDEVTDGGSGAGADGDEADGDEKEAGATAESTEEAAASPIVAATNLIKLAAVDFTLTAAEVTADSALLARLVAGNLGAGEAKVVLDGFGPVDPSGPTLVQLDTLIERLRAARVGLTKLVARTGPLGARVATLKLDVDKAQQAWSESASAKDATKEGIDSLKADLDDLRRSLAQREAALAPAQAVVDHVTQEIAEAEADLEALLAPDDTGTSPLLRACSREGLHTDDAEDPKNTAQPSLITHVLHASISHLGADTVTRRSVLGSSGRVGFLGAATANWTLADVKHGVVIAGGSAPAAAAMTYDLESAKSSWTAIGRKAHALGDDPLRKVEDRMRFGVLLVAWALMILSVAAAIASVAAIF